MTHMSSNRHVRACPGHPRLPSKSAQRSAAAHWRHRHLVAPAAAALKLLAGPELEILAHADPDFAEPGPVAGDRNRRLAEAGIDLDKGLLDFGGRHCLRIGQIQEFRRYFYR